MTRCRPDVKPILDELKRFRLTFAFRAHLFDGSHVLSSLRSSGSAESNVEVVAVREFVESDTIKATPGGVVVIIDFQRLATARDRCEWLGGLREKATEFLDSGCKILLFSEVPDLELLGCPGSSLITDAVKVYIPRVEESRLSDAASDNGYPDLTNFLVDVAKGTPVLANAAMDTIEKSEDRARKTLYEAVRRHITKDLRTAVSQCGPTLAGLLYYYVFETGQSNVGFEEVDPLVVELCRAAGMAESGDGWETMELFPEPHREVWKAALLDYIANTVEVPRDFDLVSGGLWRIERSLRLLLRNAAKRSRGSNWKGALPGIVADRCLRRSQEDAFPWATAITQLPDPFEWLTLGEALEVIESSPWARPGGVGISFWRRLVSELGPVRNRVAHMRLLRYGDLAVVQHWERRIRGMKREISSKTVDEPLA